MERKSLKLSSIILFCLLGLLVLTVIVDAHNKHHHHHDKHHNCKHNKCKTITATTTKTSTVTSSTCKPTPTLKISKLNCPHQKHDEKSCGHGNRRCTKTVTCTRTKTTCVTPQPTCIANGDPCTVETTAKCCGQACCLLGQTVGKCFDFRNGGTCP